VIGHGADGVEGHDKGRDAIDALRVSEEGEEGQHRSDRRQLGEGAGDHQREDEVELPAARRRERSVQLAHSAPEPGLMLC
jgi:hypothetical protein